MTILESYSISQEVLWFGLMLAIIALVTAAPLILSSIPNNRAFSHLGIVTGAYIFALLPPAIFLGVWFLILVQSHREIHSSFNTLFRNQKMSYLWLVFVLLYVLIIGFFHNDNMIVFMVSMGFLLLATPFSFFTKDRYLGGAHFLYIVVSILVTLSLLILLYLKNISYGTELILIVFFTTNMSDAFALVGGKVFGKRKWLSHISPGKTIAGYLSSVFTGAVFFSVAIQILGIPLDILPGVLIGALIGAYTQVGDLTASRVKRLLKLKDFGTIIPGQGGILDRLDSLIWTLPLSLILFSLWEIV